MNKLLIIDDDKSFLDSLERALKDEFSILKATTSAEAKKLFESDIDAIILDIRLNDSDENNKEGVELLKEFISLQPTIPAIMISAYGDINIAVECMKIGAADFISKPIKLKELKQRINKAIDNSKIFKKTKLLEERICQIEPSELIGKSPEMQKIKSLIQFIAKDGYITVLIRGETGTGKELVARAIHKAGWRSNEPFVPIFISSLNPNLLESEIFGHEAGAFTGANQKKIGLIEKAKGGIAFLDEIGELPLETQVKLLRFIEEKTFYRVGSSNEIKIDVQIIAATNKDLEKAIENKQFREDLYYRLKSMEIFIPPLRERIDDIPILAKHFIEMFYQQGRSRIKGINKEAMHALLEYSWPGNVRELKSAIERAIIYAEFNNDKEIKKEYLPLEIISPQKKLFNSSLGANELNLDKRLALMELNYIDEALAKARGKKSVAYKILGLNDRFALRRRVLNIFKKYPDLQQEFESIYSFFCKKTNK